MMVETKRNNVKDFGALGDGKTDDTLAIQKAIDDLYKSPIEGNTTLFKEGGIVYFPAGNYVVTKTIYITKAGISLEGVSATSSVITPKGEFKNQQLYFDTKLSGNSVFDFVYYSLAGMNGTRSFIRNVGMKNLRFDLLNLNKTTVIRLLRPYDLCIFENLLFINIRGTAIEAISEYPDNPTPPKKGLGQGLILRDIHIDNSSTVLDSLKDGTYVTFNKLLDKGRPQDADTPVIHLENINESSLTNVKIISCGQEVDLEGNIVREDKKTKTAHASRIGLLTEGCQGITIKESAFAQFSKPAIQIQKGTFGKQQTSLYHFIQGNTFEEITGSGIKIDGGTELVGRKGAGEITISENRFLGNSKSQYFYMVDNCDLITIRDRCSVFIGEGATNTTVHAVDINHLEEGLKIVDKGTRSIIMGRVYNFIDYTNAYYFSTRVVPNRFTIPVIEKLSLIREKSQKILGDMVLIQDKQEGTDQLAIMKTWEDGSLRWVNMQEELVFISTIASVKDFNATDTAIQGSCTGVENIATLRVKAIYNNNKESTVVLGGKINPDGTFDFSISGTRIDVLDCSELIVEALDFDGNILDSKADIQIKFNESLTVDDYSFTKPSYLTGTYSSLIKSIKLVSSIKAISGGTLTNGTFKFYAVGNMDRSGNCIMKGYDANGNERASTKIITTN